MRLLHEWMARSSQLDSFEVSGEIFPRGSLRCHGRRDGLSFLEEEGRLFTKGFCRKVIRVLLAEHDLRPAKKPGVSMSDYIATQSKKMMDLAKRIKSGARVRKCRARLAVLAMEAVDTLPYDGDVGNLLMCLLSFCCDYVRSGPLPWHL